MKVVLIKLKSLIGTFMQRKTWKGIAENYEKTNTTECCDWFTFDHVTTWLE